MLGDAFGAGIVAHLCRDELARMGPPQPSIEMLDRAESGAIPTHASAPNSPVQGMDYPDENFKERGNNGQALWGSTNVNKTTNNETQI